jgi:hypothetical protein
MTRKSVTDEQFGRLQRRLGELARRVDEGSVEFEPTMSALQLLVEGKRLVQQPLSEPEGDTCHVFVDYQMPRDKDELEADFSKGGVSELFYGNYEWQLHSSCQGIYQAPGEREFLVKHFDRPIESDEAIAEMDKLGYRPATHLEAYAFAKANPELQRQCWIVALGSSALYSDERRAVVLLYSYSDKRILNGYWLDSEWLASYRFLFVRKASS